MHGFACAAETAIPPGAHTALARITASLISILAAPTRPVPYRHPGTGRGVAHLEAVDTAV